jgi:stage IV sporulation protein FB
LDIPQGNAAVLIAEPPHTRFDLLFRLAGFLVRVHPTFWLTGLLLGFSGRDDTDAIELVIWVAATFISILVHELGHALLVRRNGWNSRIILYGLGGLATIEAPASYLPEYSEELPPKSKIAIASAGPGAGFVLAGLLIGLLFLCPIHFGVRTHSALGVWFKHDLDANNFPDTVAKERQRLEVQYERGSPEFKQHLDDYKTRRWLGRLIDDLLYINIFWGLINLLPVFPLDGGQIAQVLLCLKDPRKGMEKSLLLSAVAGGVVAGLGLLHFGFYCGDWLSGIFIALMFGMLAFISYRLLQQVRAMGGYGGEDDFSGYDPGDWWKR